MEYKESGPWSDLKGKIAKTALGMANIRDGGTIIIGISERSGHFEMDGASVEHLATYDPDEIQDYIHRFADPYVRTELQRFEYDNKSFVAITVHEFDEIPVICKRDGPEGSGLRSRLILTRSYRKPETVAVPSQTEMREIIDVATEKGIRSFLEKAQRVGLLREGARGQSEAERFEKQREGL